MYLTIARNVVEARARTDMGSPPLPDAKESAFMTRDAKSRTDTMVHHQCSNCARRNRNVQRLELSVIEATAVTSPCKNAVKTASPIDIHKKAVPACSLTWKRTRVGGAAG